MAPPFAPTRTHDSQEELIELGHNWFLHNPKHRAVRQRYEAIDANHPALPVTERALNGVARVLLQVPGLRATIVPCLHRATPAVPCDPYEDDVVGVVLHATLLHVEILELVHLMPSAVPVHLYIGEPLATGTPFDTYSPDRLVPPKHLLPGDPLFCGGTERTLVFGAYLHPANAPDDGALYGLSAGHAVVASPAFALHPRLQPASAVGGKKGRKRVRSSQVALRALGRPLSSPAPRVAEAALRAFELEKARVFAELERVGYQDGPLIVQRRRLQQQEGDMARLRGALARPQRLDVGHTCAAEALVRPCSSASSSSSSSEPALSRTTGSDHGHKRHHAHRSSGSSSGSSSAPDEHTHLLSWTLMRMVPARTACSGNGPALHAYPGTLERGAPVSMHVRDPNAERPLGPYRDGVVNGAPATVVLGGHLSREWAVFPPAGKRAARFAARGDAGALVTTALEGEGDGEEGLAVPLAMLYAAPERGPYGLVTPLTTILRRIRDVTGLQMRFQKPDWGVDE
ncbi:uncharacterized protein BXZ73DRAFT_76297 [Epithele typhae]|uniref:uncharacterized protein n=1 Tax=Epithele typhae TaxID=378194 RepID=UPI00200764E2|nr:uncharacterized protein BXZ73DRAFT_76297 [Epithele typhae]KAH9938789.1 hypothetical protein BXZ73DRAFT_76297 [Epithele typhae]